MLTPFPYQGNSNPTEGSSMLITSEYVQSGGRGRFYILFMIRLTTCTNDFNAQLLKGALESEGIPAMLSNEIMSGYMGTQGVDILVKEEDLEAAKKILEQQEK